MMRTNLDDYKSVYEKIRHKQYDEALNILFDIKTNQLQMQFKNDINHSWYVIGDIFYKKQNYVEAIKFFKKALNTRFDDVQALWAIANSYSELSRYKLAERYYKKAIQHANDAKELMQLTYNLGNSLFDQKRYEEAISCYEQVDKSMPEIYVLAQKNIKLFSEQA